MGKKKRKGKGIFQHWAEEIKALNCETCGYTIKECNAGACQNGRKPKDWEHKPIIYNKTPHPVHIVDEKGEVIKTFPKSENPARLATHTVQDGSIEGIPTSRTEFGEPVNLPSEVREGRYFIVSQIIKNAFSHRPDFLVPAEVVRDEEGNIIGCRSLGR